ncbi:TPA: hypothetical protein ACGR28_004982 [Klebsiella pneumoniae]
MAEVPLPTPTQVPVPSTDIRNAVFAGAKLDEEVTGTGEFYTDRLGAKRLTNTGRNNQFDAAQLDRANRFEQFLLSSGYVFLGDYEDGPFQFSARNQYIRYNDQYYRLNATTDVGFTTTGTDAISFANDVAHFVLMDGDTLRQKLGSSEEGMGGDLVAYKSRTVSQRLSDKVTLTDYPGAVEGRDNDSTAAFVAAYATGHFVYVPAGDWFTHTYIPNKTFGEGRIWCDGDGLYPDAGERVVNPGISHQRNYLYRAETWGNKERAAGWSLMVNNEDGRPEVSGFNDNTMANYVNFDQVGIFASMRGNRDFFYTAAANTTYTQFSIQAPEITSDKKVEPGMLISTSHSPRFKGRVMSVDFDTNTIAVSKWVAEGNPADGQVPPNNVRAVVNGADKLWAANLNLFIDSNSPAKTGCGLEIDIITDGTHGNPVEGYTVSNANSLGNPFNYGFRAMGAWITTVYASSSQQNGLTHIDPPGAAVRVPNLTNSDWTGAVVLLDTNYRKSTSYLAKIMSGGVPHFSINSQGVRNVQRESYGVVSTGTTITGLSASEISCINANDVTITLNLSTTSFVAGQVIHIRATGGPVIVGGITLNDANGRYIQFLFDGVGFIKRFQTN